MDEGQALPVADAPAGLESAESCDSLELALDAAWRDEAAGETGRERVLAVLRAARDRERAAIRARFESGACDGAAVLAAIAASTDTLIVALARHLARRVYPDANPSTGERIALAAVGGYGRRELAPGSDIDLLFLLPYKITPWGEQIVEAVLYSLWDLGFKVGHATRGIDDCLRRAREDLTIRTALLEARFLWGERPLFDELRRRYDADLRRGGAVAFIEGKLAERDERHKRMGESRYQLEPNIKESKGGLRDLSTLFWIVKYVYGVDDLDTLMANGVFTPEEARRFDKAQHFLWTVRCHLHYLSGRAEERLTFDLQREIAGRMGYHDHAGTVAVERLMKHYYLVAREVGELTRLLCAQLESEHKRRARFALPRLRRRPGIAGFEIEGDRLSVAGAAAFRERPIRMLRIFAVAQKHGLDIHPRTLRWIDRNLKRIDTRLREDPEATRIFLNILTSSHDPETALRRMNEAGVLGRFLPEFGRIVAQMQYNMYHHYTVDEHTIFAIGELHRIERGDLKQIAPIASEVIHKVHSRRALYLAVLLHDIGKGRSGDHSEIGAQIALKVCPRLGLSAEETETIAWLVRHHLDMSAVAFKRDLAEPRTIHDFAEHVQSLERLRLLLCLTVADIRAVGPGTWNDWKAALLRDLYWATEDELAGGFHAESRDTRVERAKAALDEHLADWPEAARRHHLERPYPAYWLGCDTESQARHAELIRQADIAGRRISVDTRVDAYRNVTEVTVYTEDHPGLFSRIAGALALAGASITQARIFTLKDGMALDSFWVRDAGGGAFDDAAKQARAVEAIEATLAGDLNPRAALAERRTTIPSRYTVFQVPPRVFLDNTLSARHTVIEVNGRDRSALLHDLTQALYRLNLMIHGAKISTFGERVVDVFYVQDLTGSKVAAGPRHKRIRQRLMAVLDQGEAGEGPDDVETETQPPATWAALP